MTPLYERAQWVVVLLVPLPDGKTDKLPLDYRTAQVTPKGSDGAHNPYFWTTYENARSLAAAWGPQFTVGFVITAADPFWCLDIDGALQPDGSWSPLSQQLVSALPGTCVEISQSGRGLHIWGQGPVPPHAKKNVPLHIELYSERRFIALGTQAVGDMSGVCPQIAAVAAYYFPPKLAGGETPDDGPCADWNGPVDDADLIRRAMQSRSAAGIFGGGAKASFADLWHAEAGVLSQAYPPDNAHDPFNGSSADAALAQHLAFWTGKDVARIERLMRQSKLARSKWDERDDYLVDRTIMNACSMQQDVLKDKPVELPAHLQAPPPAQDGPPAAATGSPSHAMPRQTPVTGDTFLSAAAQTAVFEGCVYVMDAHRALVPGGHLYKPDQFKAMFGGYTFAMDARNERTCRNAWEAFTESQVLKAPRADGSCFRPELPYGTIVHDAGRSRVNTWWPVKVPRKVGDVTPFLRHLAKLLPVQSDQHSLLCYMAACVQHQGYKFQWAPVIQGVEGNGKTLLSRCVAEAIGRRYVFWPKAKKIAAQFNGWLVGHTFIAVEDIHTSENVDVLEELKPMITGGDGLEIEKKGVDQTSADICCNFMFNTNHKNGIRKTGNDRRLAIYYTAQQWATDLARDGMAGSYMFDLYHWLKHEDGYALVAEYLWTFPIPDAQNPARDCQRAPRTTSTDEAIEQGRGRVEQEILEAIDRADTGFMGGWVSSIAVDRLLDRMGRAGAVPPNRRRDVLVSLGYDWHPALVKGRVNNFLETDGGKPKLFVNAGHLSLMLTAPAQVAQAYVAAQKPGK